MIHSIIKSFTILSILFLFIMPQLKCSSKTQFNDDAVIQEDITNAVNNYSSENWEIRLNSIKRMSRYTGTAYAKNSLMLVIKAMDDSHSKVRIESLIILQNLRISAVEEKIKNIALSDENANVRHFAFIALGEYNNIDNEKTFLEGLNDKDWFVKEAALEGLMKINDPEIQIKHLDIIIKSINDKNISLKLTAISNISIKDQLIYEELAKIINNKESGLSILKAALQKIKGYKLDNTTKKRIIELLTHRDKNIRLLSLQVLKQEELNLNL